MIDELGIERLQYSCQANPYALLLIFPDAASPAIPDWHFSPDTLLYHLTFRFIG